MPRYALVLYPQNPELLIEDKTALLRELVDIGLIDKTIPGEKSAWYAGEQFVSLISFLGCSPYVRFAPDEECSRFTYISWQTLDSEPALHAGENLKPPRCPECKTAAESRLANDYQLDKELTCSQCLQSFPLQQWSWRQSACYAKETIWIWEVFEGEAVPGDVVMKVLEKQTNTRWSYCYIAVSEQTQ